MVLSKVIKKLKRFKKQYGNINLRLSVEVDKKIFYIDRKTELFDLDNDGKKSYVCLNYTLLK